jgi:hypothetical protein
MPEMVLKKKLQSKNKWSSRYFYIDFIADLNRSRSADYESVEKITIGFLDHELFSFVTLARLLPPFLAKFAKLPN